LQSDSAPLFLLQMDEFLTEIHWTVQLVGNYENRLTTNFQNSIRNPAMEQVKQIENGHNLMSLPKFNNLLRQKVLNPNSKTTNIELTKTVFYYIQVLFWRLLG